ncbi:hypothetical protein, partial [Aphanothece microscopica]|uniref:hypothetical protein n=1 Tax=Aphanothece microscopica TaxID=1049561 RepID=UPI0039852D36
TNCCSEFLKSTTAPLVVMFGLGSRLNYVQACKALFSKVLGGSWRSVNEVAYTNGALTVVHVEHFASQGRLIPEWLGQLNTARHQYCVQAREAIKAALSPQDLSNVRNHAATISAS